jgi:4-hydroxy-3-methylbut-2-enyl diphosphate reductase IspH
MKAELDNDQLPVAYAALCAAFEVALTHIAEMSSADDWHVEVYEKIQRQLDTLNELFTAASLIERENLLPSQKDMPGAIRAGSATIDALFDSVLTKLRQGRRDAER